VFKTGEVETFAEFLGMENNMLEARRKELTRGYLREMRSEE